MLSDSNVLIGLHIPAALLPQWLIWLANGLMLVVLALCLRRHVLRDLLANRPSQHVFFGSMVFLLLLWGIKAGISPGLGFHQLGATLFMLMFGWPLAIVGLSVIMLVNVLIQHNEVLSLGINGLLSIALPVAVSYGILRLSQRYLPDNFFIYIFVAAFFGAGIAVAVSRLGAMALLALVHAYPNQQLVYESLLYVPLFMFPEAFVTGMLASIFAVYRPDWLLTFDDERYIIGK